MRKVYSGLIGAGVLAATLTVVPLAIAEGTTETQELKVLSWNICGEAGGLRGEAGYCPYRNDPAAKVEQIAGLATDLDLDVILLQEVCAETADSHLGLLEVALGDEWQFGHARGARPDGRTDCRGDFLNGQLGVAIAVKSPSAEFESMDTLPPDPKGTNKATLPIICATTSQWSTKVCNVHLLADPKDTRRAQQIKNVRDYVWDDRQDLVLGGDFNQFPGAPELRPISDNFTECDSKAYSETDKVNERTHHTWRDEKHVYTKRDHIFAGQSGSAAPFTACDSKTALMDTTKNILGSDLPPNGYSDHAPVFGVLTI